MQEEQMEYSSAERTNSQIHHHGRQTMHMQYHNLGLQQHASVPPSAAPKNKCCDMLRLHLLDLRGLPPCAHVHATQCVGTNYGKKVIP